MNREELEQRKIELEELIDQSDIDDDGNFIEVHEPSALMDYINALMDEYHQILDRIARLT